jgi:putative transcriptional regulator
MIMGPGPPLALALVGTALSRGPSEAAKPAESVKPGPGVFLVAKPSIEGGPFWHSVVLILAHGDEGTLGLIINRATEVPLAEAMPDLKDDRAKTHALHFGGPVALNGLLFLFRSEDPPGDVAPVMGNVYFSGDRKILEKLVSGGENQDRLKLYLGHAGWAPGQLQNEIARGDWSLAPADAFTVFQKEPDAIWPELSRNTGKVVAGLSPSSQRAFASFR